jgi:hypothetical protein
MNLDDLKQRAAGRWPEILAKLGNVPKEILDGRHHPCPKCGGADRFRLIDAQAGAVLCNQCFSSENGDGFSALRWLTGKNFNETLTAVEELLENSNSKQKQPNKPKIVATYNYTDEQGKLLFQVCRREPGAKGEKKDFIQRRPKSGGGWEYKVKGTKLVPYRLPELLAADQGDIILIVEGEKDADRAASLGLIATTNAMGAGKWRKEYNQFFRSRDVVIIPDNDQPGREHVNQVARNLRGIAKSIKILELPGLMEKGDLSDWLDAGHSKEELNELIKTTPTWSPTDKDSKTTLPDFTPFPTEALPKVVADFVRQGAAALGCDESYIALPLLTMLSAAVGNSRRIQLKRSWSEPAIIWTVVVGESGTLKSPALDLALKPIRRVQDAAFRQHAEDMDLFQRDKANYEADLAQWKKSGRKNGEPPPESPAEPIASRYITTDCTVEALAVLLQEQPRGLLVARDELSGWINSFDAYKSCHGADVAHWLSMHRAGALTVDRKIGRRVIHVPRAAVCITGTVQPMALASALVGRYSPQDAEAMDKSQKEHFDNGLAARLLFAMPPQKPKKWSEDEIPYSYEISIKELFEKLLDLEMLVDEKGLTQSIDIPLNPDGKCEWVRFYNLHAEETAELRGELAAAWSKLEGYAARFALLIHLIRCASDESSLANPDEIDEHSIKAGVTISRWFGSEASRVYQVLNASREKPEAREKRELMRIVIERGGRITVRELMHATRKYRNSASEAEAALNLLVKEKKGAWESAGHGSGPGRPAKVFRLFSGQGGDTISENLGKTAIVLPSPLDVDSENEVVEWSA